MKIICVGRNYAEHARELGNEVPEEPVLFMKQPLLFQLRANGQIQFSGVCAQAARGAVSMTAGVAAVLDPSTTIARTRCY